ncbi:hypothetical protein [Conexibacter sp. SYSU D00693]|uniref:hypothetical protein n=1 Tax=Conexibacter sp. SYSU D00693 TaxID=2812560 RepID=UPI00196B7C4C|nr:hypothetical protein [Conexibacter sp. SYSU D00693]
MQSTKTAGGWFKVHHDAWDLILRECAPSARQRALLVYSALTKLGNEHRAAVFDATRAKVAATAGGISVDTVDRAVPDLVDLGLIGYAPGKRGGESTWTVGTAVGSRRVRQEVPHGAGGGAAPCGSTRARPLRGEEVEEEKKDAPDGARSLGIEGTATDDLTGRLLKRYLAAMERHLGRPPRAPSKTDVDRARALAARVGDDLRSVDEVLAFALADEFYAQHSVPFARFEAMFDKVQAALSARAAARREAGDDLAGEADEWSGVVESLVTESIRLGEVVDPPDGMPGWALRQYDNEIAAARCRGCDKLGRWSSAQGGACSRRCQLQAEYAAAIATSNDDIEF